MALLELLPRLAVLPVWGAGLFMMFYGYVFANNGLSGRDPKQKMAGLPAPRELKWRVVSVVFGLLLVLGGFWVVVETGVRPEQATFGAEDGTRVTIPTATVGVAGVEPEALQPEAIRLIREWDELPEDAREEKLEGVFGALPPDTQVWMVEPDGEGFKEGAWGNLDDTSKRLLVEDVGRFEPGIH